VSLTVAALHPMQPGAAGIFALDAGCIQSQNRILMD